MNREDKDKIVVLISNRLNSMICDVHKENVLFFTISDNLITDFQTCCPEFGQKVNDAIEAVNPKRII